MLDSMVERVFLGWDRPFLAKTVAWLLERRGELPGMMVVVPTAQSGRRLREALAEAAGAVMSPQVVTPGSFLQFGDAVAATDWSERVAWVEVLESIGDWSEFGALFPEPPGEERNWAGGLAQEMLRLRHSLQENGLMMANAAWKLRDTVEAERWQALARLEELVEKKLQSWGEKSRSRILAEGLSMPGGISRIVLAGVAEMPPLVERAWLAWEKRVTALIGAPENEAAGFSPIGRALESWTERRQPWPDGSVQVVADPRQQAVEALRVVGEMGTPSNEVALGSADTEVGEELAHAFTREGWPTFHPAAIGVTGGLTHWFRIWSAWLGDPTLAAMSNLLALPETGVLVSGKRAQKAKTLAELRDRWMVARTDDLRRRIAAETFRTDADKVAAEELLAAAEGLENWRASFLRENFAGSMERMLGVLARCGPKTQETSAAMAQWLADAVPLMEKVRRGATFWIELMLSGIPSPVPLPPAGRVLDVQGWLELFHEPGRHLVLCGMNDGKVPARGGGEPWLSEAGRDRLGLIKDSDRAARDAFLYHSMLEARKDGGRVDVICGKNGAGGESLLPSRLLLAAGRDELPGRVKLLFKEVEPPEAGLRRETDWKWQPRTVEPPKRLNVTSLGDYLACPFRYYLKHAVKMQCSETGRAEWNARDFGNVTHEVLERWGRDTEARDFEKPEAIHDWLSAELNRVVAEWFGKRSPLAVRIQTEALRQRFLWLSRVQAANRIDGWEVVDVERKVELPVGGASIVAKIDRIDRHRESGRLRVLDYKTGKVDSVDKAHRKKLTSGTTLASHLSRECPAVYLGEDKGKTAEFLWHNLQLPLYAAALVKRGDPMPAPCYFTLRSTEADVAIHEWSGFEPADLEAAEACAEWVAGRIAAGIFWPPAEKVTYDDYSILAAGRTLEEMVRH
ncbi:PD-(D/E)XK nuclease family protein [Luteolibacter yonseiensis]|uniref:PD-(D/E)XK nuclease family protein n=1 Tax=Luteolibacter yonseiensis TaxID=1144680 RepID=A0A934R4B5_9BACT|nr:PD-(D/E)XK nuclease family protein [Luteolibacter yonseiensis]MBK1816659.1 PD-(D/E)XK nuclease family protein [Luteolibacter yonseiensis]